MAEAQKRQIALVAFLQAQNCSNLPASWRHPDTESDFLTPGFYQRIARTLEYGKFHLAFFDDRLAMPDRYGDSYADTVRAGVRAVKLDLPTIMMAMGMATSRIGLGGTYSTTYYEPFHVARVFATLDLMIGGRAAWNVVTSLNDSEAANFGHDQILHHDLRYDRADEFMEVVLGHWDTWEDGALIIDKASRVFGDPNKVHRLEHKGKFFRSRGPFTVPRSAQGRPVVIQAGQSGRGSKFAAQWAELIFVSYPNLEFAKRSYANVKKEIQAAGRDPDKVRIAPAVNIIIGETRGAAEDKAALVESLVEPIDQLALLSEVLNFDFATKDIDDAFTAEEMAGISGLQAMRDRVVQMSGKPNPTVRDFLKFSNRGTPREIPFFVGTAKEVTDTMEEWFTTGACDGFVISASYMPGTYEEVARQVVPELQRRGLFHKDYAGATLRENLGMPVAQRGDWKR